MAANQKLATLLATLTGLALFFPAYFAAGVVAHLLPHYMRGWEPSAPAWLPILDGLYNFVWHRAIPEFVSGFLGATFGILAGVSFFKRSNPTVVARVVAAICIAIGVLIGLSHASQTDFIAVMAQGASGWLGVLVGATAAHSQSLSAAGRKGTHAT